MRSLSKPAKILGLLLIGGLYLSTAANQLGDWSGDAATYILLGKSLAQGNGYMDPILPGSYPFTKYPFLFPAILSPVIRIFGVNFLAIRVEVALVALASVIFWYFYFRDRFKASAGLGLTLAFALHPYSISFITRTLSETPYLLLTGMTLWAYNHWRDTGKGIHLATSLACAVLAFFCRTAGVALFGALLLGVMFEPRLRSRKVLKIPAILAVVLVSLLAAGAWSGYVFAHPTPVVNYFQEMFQPIMEGNHINAGVVMSRAGSNIWYYFSSLSGQLLPGLGTDSATSMIISAFLWLLVAIGAIQAAKNKRLVEVFYFCLSIATVMVWPNYMEFRFVFPLMPLMIMFGYEAIKLIAASFSSKTSSNIFAYALFVIFSGAWLCFSGLIVAAQHRPNPYPASAQDMFGFKTEKSAVDWSKTFYAFNTPKSITKLGDFIVLNQIAAKIAEQPSIIASEKPSDTALVTGHRSVRLPISTNPAEAVLYLESWKVDYLIVDRFSRQTDFAVVPLIEDHPGLFEKIAGLPGQTSPGIYKFRH